MEAAYLNMVALQIPASSPRPQSSCHVDAMAKSNIQVSRFIWPLYCSVKTQEYSKVKEKKSDEHVALHPVLVQPWLQEGLTAKQPTWEEKVTKKVCDFQQDLSKRPKLCPKLWRHECALAKAWCIRSFTRQTSFPSMESSFFTGSDSVEMQMLRPCLDLMERFVLSVCLPNQTSASDPTPNTLNDAH